MRYHATIENPDPNHMHLQGGQYWLVSYDDPFKLVVKVEADNHAEAGRKVGLIQTLIHSEREAQYGHAHDAGGVVTYTFHTVKTPPCLDSHPKYRPFYDQNCDARSIPASGPAQLEMRDDPFGNFPMALKHSTGNHEKKIITRVHMKEDFLVSLVEFDANHRPGTQDSAAWNHTVKAQWTWGYDYVIEPIKPDGHNPKRVSSVVNRITEIHAGSMHLVADGNPAEVGAKFVSIPAGWEAVH